MIEPSHPITFCQGKFKLVMHHTYEIISVVYADEYGPCVSWVLDHRRHVKIVPRKEDDRSS